MGYTKEEKSKYFQGIQAECWGLYDKFFKEASLSDIVKVKMATGNSYSIYNSLYAMSQANRKGVRFTGRMKGWKQWEASGNPVLPENSGKFFHILAPLFKKVVDKKTGIEETKLVWFKVVKVYDCSLTGDGERYEREMAEKVYKQAVSMEDALAWAGEHFSDVQIAREPEHDGYGAYRPTEPGKITLYKDADGHTVLHEMGHLVMREHLKKDKASYAMGEIYAEVFAFMVMTGCLGLDEGAYNFAYSQCWASKLPEVEKQKGQQVFKEVWTEIEGVLKDGVKEVEAAA